MLNYRRVKLGHSLIISDHFEQKQPYCKYFDFTTQKDLNNAPSDEPLLGLRTSSKHIEQNKIQCV